MPKIKKPIKFITAVKVLPLRSPELSRELQDNFWNKRFRANGFVHLWHVEVLA